MPLIDPGKKAPAFSLNDQNGKTHRLADYAGRPVAVALSERRHAGLHEGSVRVSRQPAEVQDEQSVVLGISILDEASKARFATKYDLTFPLLADEDHAVAEKYGVWQEKSLYGRNFMGLVRTTYLIGSDGKVVKRWDKVKVDGHAEAVLAAL
jgi:peroxiredoxin Q/BCP